MRRHRVRLRPKARAARRGAAGRAAAALGLAGTLAVGAAFKPWRRARLPVLPLGPLRRVLVVDSVTVAGAPDAAARELEAALAFVPGRAWGPLEAGRRAAALKSRFGWVESVGVSRSWLRRSVAFTVVPRGAVASVEGARGEEDGAALLAEDGTVYAAAPGAPPPAGLARVDLSGWPGGDLTGAVRLVRAASAPGALPAPPAAFAYDARERGWDVTLADGTRLEWGGLDWTDEKLARLREVLADASPRFKRSVTADLRFFDDGRILVRQ